MPFVEVQFTQVVAQLDYFGRLHESGESGGRFVLYETLDFTAVGGEERNDGPAVADGYLGSFWCPAFTFGTGKGAVDLSLHLGGFAGFSASYLGQSWGSIVVEFAMVVDEFP